MKTEYILYACAVYLAWDAWRKLRGRKVSLTSILLILHDGTSTVVHKARRDDAGNLIVGNTTYPAGVGIRCENEADLSHPVYLYGADALALAHHRTLEQARRHIVMGSLFKSGGDLVEFLRLGASALVIACALYGLMQVRTLSGSLAEFDASLQAVNEKLSKPLVVAPPENKK